MARDVCRDQPGELPTSSAVMLALSLCGPKSLLLPLFTSPESHITVILCWTLCMASLTFSRWHHRPVNYPYCLYHGNIPWCGCQHHLGCPWGPCLHCSNNWPSCSGMGFTRPAIRWSRLWMAPFIVSAVTADLFSDLFATCCLNPHWGCQHCSGCRSMHPMRNLDSQQGG